MKKLIIVVLTLALIFAVGAPAMASDDPNTAAGSPYAAATTYETECTVAPQVTLTAPGVVKVTVVNATPSIAMTAGAENKITLGAITNNTFSITNGSTAGYGSGATVFSGNIDVTATVNGAAATKYTVTLDGWTDNGTNIAGSRKLAGLTSSTTANTALTIKYAITTAGSVVYEDKGSDANSLAALAAEVAGAVVTLKIDPVMKS